MRGMPVIPCVICGFTGEGSRYPNRSQVCRYCKTVSRNLLAKGFTPEQIAVEVGRRRGYHETPRILRLYDSHGREWLKGLLEIPRVLKEAWGNG